MEREAAAWHALYIAYPQELLLQGPGYLFPGPSYLVGPYPAGEVMFRLDVYDNYPPNGYMGAAGAVVIGEYPAWTIRFEDGWDEDYNDIVIRVEAAPGLQLDCNPPSVERAAQPVHCAASAPSGSNMEVTGWEFVGGPNNEFTITPATTLSDTWEGPMVVSGVVKVRALVDGQPDSATALIIVTPRSSWGNTPFTDLGELSQFGSYQDRDFYVDIPAIPTRFGDLGKAYAGFKYDNTYGEGVGNPAAIPTGPNNLLFYNAAPPFTQIEAWRVINRDALTNRQNAWYLSHPKGGSGSVCKQRQLETDILDLVVNHELQHTAFTLNWFKGSGAPERDPNYAVEAVVAQGRQAVMDASAAAVIPLLNQENVANKAAVDASGVSFPCRMLDLQPGEPI